MEFHDLRPIGEAASSPTIQTTAKSVLITIPHHLADSAGFSAAARVRVRLGESGKAKALLIGVSNGDGWSLTRRTNVMQLFVREIRPKAAVSPTDLVFRIQPDGLVLSLPPPWDLAEPHVVIRTVAKASASPSD